MDMVDAILEGRPCGGDPQRCGYVHTEWAACGVTHHVQCACTDGVDQVDKEVTVTETPVSDKQLLTLCKLLLDEDRLRLLGLLALGPRTQAELIDQTSMKAGVLARHLYQLQEARLVATQRQDGVDRYAINVERIQTLKRHLFAPPPSAEPQSEAEEVLSRFVENGRLTQLPTAHTKLPVVLAWLAEEFRPGEEYPERRVNEILDKHASDPATLRRLLVDYQFLTRSGGIYRRVSTSKSETA